MIAQLVGRSDNDPGVAATRMPQAMVTTSEVVDVVIGLLAETEGVTISELIAELATAGPDLAIDSLRIVEILTRVEGRCEVILPADPVTARSTRSVLSFAQVVVNAINEEGQT